MTEPRTRITGHKITTKLDHQRGGWVWSCSCGAEAKRASWYKARAANWANEHLAQEEGRRTNGAPNHLDPLQSQEVHAS